MHRTLYLPFSFQSTLPLRGATYKIIGYTATREISIHAPLTGSDDSRFDDYIISADFNPRSPYGERRNHKAPPYFTIRFQSTLPLRGATTQARHIRRAIAISIHAPLTGSDNNQQQPYQNQTISIHAPLTGSDPRAFHFAYPIFDFNPRSPYGERL